MANKRILLVGHRKGAIAAALRCGWEPVSIDVAARREQTGGAFGGTMKWAIAEAESLFPENPPAFVTAVATGSVVAAAAIRQHFGLPGICPETAMRCHDKLVMKKTIVAAGVPCAPWMETTEESSPAELIDTLGLPVILKLPISSGGRGVWICQTAEEIELHLRPGLLAESFVKGTEMSVETFRAKGKTLFRNHTRYLKPRWANVVPADLDVSTAMPVDRLSESVQSALGIQTGISHMEVFLTENGPVFSEIAARPPGGFLMDLMARAYDFDPWEFLLRIANGETPEAPVSHNQFAGVWLLHPGEGTLKEIHGIIAARATPGIVKATCHLKPGDVTTARVGSGEIKGRIIAEAPTSADCASSLQQAAAQVHFTLT